MNYSNILPATSVLILTISGASAQSAINPAWGADAYGFIANRTSGSISTSPFNSPPDGGGEGFTSDNASLSELRGTINATAQISPGATIRSPLIRSFAQTNNGNWAASSGATVVEGYSYAGASPGTFDVDVNLSGAFSNLDNDFAGNFARVSVYVFGPEQLNADPDEFFFTTDRGGYLEGGFVEAAGLSLEQNGIGTDDLTSGTVSWTMNDGDTAYLWVQGFSRVYGPNSTADASNTLVTSFRSASGLTAFSAVPEPSSLMLGAMGALAFFRRRERK